MDDRPRVLFVDDEVNILKALRRLFRDKPWDLSFSASGAEALALLDAGPFDLIVTDQRMPGMTGVALLKEVRARQPACARVVLSGYADVQSILDAVNDGAVCKFLLKPWDDAVLRETVAEAVESVRLRRENERLRFLVETQNDQLLAVNQSLQTILWEDMGIRALLDAVPVGFLAVNREGELVASNRYAQCLVGAGRSHAAGGEQPWTPEALRATPGFVVRKGELVDTPGWHAQTYVFWQE